MLGFSAAMQMTPQDRIYVCLPFYHTSGGVIAVGSALMAGGTAVIREKFSAKQFWDDIADSIARCSSISASFAAISSTARRIQKKHHTGSGSSAATACAPTSGEPSRRDSAFQKSWNGMPPPRAMRCSSTSTERRGRLAAYRAGRNVGSPSRSSSSTWRSEQPVRGPDGFCIKCATNQPGEVLSQILNDPSKPSQRFEGYADAAATQKKILRDVFVKGDSWFRTGDLMRKDERRLFLLRRPYRRYVPLEGRERRYVGSVRGVDRISRRKGGQCLRRGGPGA